MATAPQTADSPEIHRAVALYHEHGGNVSVAARSAGVPRGTLQHQVQRAKELGLLFIRPESPMASEPQSKGFAVEELPDELPTAEELRERRKTQFARKHAASEARRLVPIRVTLNGPIGIAHVGDPHVDDDGTDIALLESHVATIGKTEGLFGANVGDLTNNWVGRLARLYGQQSTSAAEAWVLADWLMTAIPWMYIVGGNHDVWSGDADPLKWLAKQARTLYEWHGVRINLQFPNGRAVRVNARHDFKGHSQWNTAHGAAKAVQMGWRDHVLTCGHTHVSGYQVLRDPSSGLISHTLRVGSYKTLDRYAAEKGMPNQTVFVCPVTIIQPQYADDDPRLITVIFDPLEGADYLSFLRRRK